LPAHLAHAIAAQTHSHTKAMARAKYPPACSNANVQYRLFPSVTGTLKLDKSLKFEFIEIGRVVEYIKLNID
jgi:hypothetical protein